MRWKFPWKYDAFENFIHSHDFYSIMKKNQVYMNLISKYNKGKKWENYSKWGENSICSQKDQVIFIKYYLCPDMQFQIFLLYVFVHTCFWREKQM